MNKASLFASAAVVALLAGASAPVFAQGAGGPFADVPVDHWAYKSVDTLQKQGIVIGYPDGTFGGKRAMTRYEFAVAIARLLEKIPQPDLTPYVKKDDLPGILAPYAKQSDLDALSQKEAGDVADIKKLMQEFQTELTTLGVDVEAMKHRLDALEGRVNAIEAEQRRVKVGATINIMARGNNTLNDSPFVTDLDGFKVGKGATYNTGATTVNGKSGIFSDSSVLHDVDISIKGRLSDTASAEAIINYGNYLPYIGSISSYTNETTNTGRSSVGGLNTVNQTEAFSVYKAVVEAATRLPYIGGVNVTVGRLPIQFTPYTLKLIDTDSYFYNAKTDLGDIPVDGGKVGFKVGGISATGFAAKTDPIAFVSDENGVVANSTGDAGYGLYAGAGKGAFGNGTSGFASGAGRPIGSLINPTTLGQGNGAMFVEQMAGVHATGDIGKIAIGGTYLVLAGSHGDTQLSPNPNLNFDRVFVYGGDISTHLTPVIGVTGSYTKTDTGGPQITQFSNGVISSVDTGTHSDVTNNNEAWDAALTFTPGALTLIGGYKHVGPYFGAPGSWDKLGSWTNPVDIKGPYVKAKYAITSSLAFEAAGKFYTGTGEATANGGITTDDKITNAKAGFKYLLSSPSNIDLGVEETQYKIGEDAFAGQGLQGRKPTEYVVNVGYGYAFTPATSFKLGYQWINFVTDGTGTSFDPNGSQRGGIATTQFSVKF